MPTYEYACRDCGKHVEVVQSFKEDPLTECGICKGLLRKVFSPAGIIFKGSGYYVTDTRKKADSAASTSKDAAKSTSKSADPAKSTSGTAGNSSKNDAAKSA